MSSDYRSGTSSRKVAAQMVMAECVTGNGLVGLLIIVVIIAIIWKTFFG